MRSAKPGNHLKPFMTQVNETLLVRSLLVKTDHVLRVQRNYFEQSAVIGVRICPVLRLFRCLVMLILRVVKQSLQVGTKLGVVS